MTCYAKQLGSESQIEHLLANSAPLLDFYVDDVLPAGNYLEDPIIIQQQFVQILDDAGFPRTQ